MLDLLLTTINQRVVSLVNPTDHAFRAVMLGILRWHGSRSLRGSTARFAHLVTPIEHRFETLDSRGFPVHAQLASPLFSWLSGFAVQALRQFRAVSRPTLARDLKFSIFLSHGDTQQILVQLFTSAAPTHPTARWPLRGLIPRADFGWRGTSQTGLLTVLIGHWKQHSGGVGTPVLLSSLRPAWTKILFRHHGLILERVFHHVRLDTVSLR